MKKAKTNSETKEKLIITALQLMQAKGFVSTTVDEICQTAGLSKGSFFHYFESKEAIGKAVLDYFTSAVHSVLENDNSSNNESDPLKRLDGRIDMFITVSTNPDRIFTCLAGNFAQSLSDTHPEIRDMCGDFFSWLAARFKQDLDEAKAKYAPDAAINTQDLADNFLAAYEGSLILAKAKQDPSMLERTLLVYRQHIHDIFEK